MLKLEKYIKCTASIEALTNLHIGGSKESFKKGEIDNPVIKNPVNLKPYIPGSSLKGKFRMSLELKYKDYTNSGDPTDEYNDDSLVGKLFGVSKAKNSTEPTRLLFRDAYLKEGLEGDYVGNFEKVELKMDRNKLAGSSTGPRVQEIVPAGAEFEFEVTLRIFEDDIEKEFIDKIKEAINIIENDAIGGAGSRGYGKVKFKDFNCEEIKI